MASLSVLALLGLATHSAAADAPECGLYDYRAEVVRVIDGDTIVADIDLGFFTWRRGEHLRLSKIDSPEARGESRAEGLRAKAALQALIEGREVVICTEKDARGSFGRFLAEVWVDGMSVNEWMLRNDYARLYDGS